ncbi:alpha/beta hydrolase [Natronohydrobacter thiooxidans]|uniref:alpha/beta hydrolase n=1 Tax=Natronohydrobacter thiooxidans TaxID=87172 RepID=UPI0008FF6FC1|nr:alpha/beta hydrolase [Natronohydrobacter thiooxidans]
MIRRTALLVLLAAGLGLGWKALPGRTPVLTGPDPIAALEPVAIGGMTQWLLIRGHDRTAPVILWLHGGPGAAQMPLPHATTRALERDFVLVHWDQRGAGKSNPRGFDPATMTLEQFLQDAHEVTRYLQARLGTERILVLGHSWGTMLGARLVARWPEEYAGYIGVGQQVSTPRGVAVTLDRLAPLIRADGNSADLRWLEGATPEGLMKHAAYVAMMQRLDRYSGGMNVPTWRLALMLARAPEYSLGDLWRWLDGAIRGSGSMWPDYRSRDLLAEVPEMPVPMLLISGARVLNTPVELAAEWFVGVDAPQGKRHEVLKPPATRPS